MNTKKMSKPKTILLAVILIFTTVLLPMLQSCDENDSVIDSGNSNQSTDSNDKSVKSDNKTNNTTEKKPDITSVNMQEPNNKLLIFINSLNDNILTPALNIFKEKYPDVEVELREWGGISIVGEGPGSYAITEEGEIKAYRQVLQTELMAGKGPDLIVGYTDDIENLYKVMDTGLFADLNPFIENDGEFNLDDYVKTVLDAGIYKGKRYAMPLEYNVPLLLTTQEILDAEGIKPSDFNTFDGFFNTINKYTEKYKDNPKKSVFKNDSPNAHHLLSMIFPQCGIEIIDWENGKVNTGDPCFKTVMDAMKWAYVPEKDEVDIEWGGDGITLSAMREQNWLFGLNEGYNPDVFAYRNGYLRYNELTPVYFTYPNIDNKTTASVGKFAAIPQASQNQINAYNLLKIIMSEDIQSSGVARFTYIPVLKSAARKIYEYRYNENASSAKKNFLFQWKESPNPKEEAEHYMDMITNIDLCKLTESTSWNDFFIKDMRPYYEGKQTFEQFVKKLKNDLELYISE